MSKFYRTFAPNLMDQNKFTFFEPHDGYKNNTWNSSVDWRCLPTWMGV